MNKSQIGIIGLGVMGKSISLNFVSKNIKISMFNRHVDGVEEEVAVKFKKENPILSTTEAFDNLKDFVLSIQKPRSILIMVNAGKAIDSVITDLLPFISENDILIDGGNSYFKNTNTRFNFLKSKHINFIGLGISGGEEGALKGPSLMPGGEKKAYNSIKPMLEAVAAKDSNNLPCCKYIGAEGSGHFVKMVHNGIEYVEMQLLAEIYSIFLTMKKSHEEIANILETWKETVNSYLLEITIDILRKKEGNRELVTLILDKAQNKSTGSWATAIAAELGVPCTLIASALFARYTSYFKEERVQLNRVYNHVNPRDPKLEINDLLHAYQFARVINHYQGFNLIFEASKTYGWNIRLKDVAKVWTGGCIIKSDFMVKLVSTLVQKNILKDKTIIDDLKRLKPFTNKVVSQCVLHEIAIPCISEALSFFHSATTANSTANLIQAQRDYFGAHTYQKIDDDTGLYYHTIWK